MDDHLGSAKHDSARRDGGNSRNGTRTKQLLTDVGPVEVAIPRDRDGSFEPQIVGKRQRRLSEIDGLVISLSAKGLTHGEIAAHLAEVYDAQVCLAPGDHPDLRNTPVAQQLSLRLEEGLGRDRQRP